MNSDIETQQPRYGTDAAPPPPKPRLPRLGPVDFVRHHIDKDIGITYTRMKDHIAVAAQAMNGAMEACTAENEADSDAHQLNEYLLDATEAVGRINALAAELRGMKQAKSILRRAQKPVDNAQAR